MELNTWMMMIVNYAEYNIMNKIINRLILIFLYILVFPVFGITLVVLPFLWILTGIISFKYFEIYLSFINKYINNHIQ